MVGTRLLTQISFVFAASGLLYISYLNSMQYEYILPPLTSFQVNFISNLKYDEKSFYQDSMLKSTLDSLMETDVFKKPKERIRIHLTFAFDGGEVTNSDNLVMTHIENMFDYALDGIRTIICVDTHQHIVRYVNWSNNFNVKVKDKVFYLGMKSMRKNIITFFSSQFDYSFLSDNELNDVNDNRVILQVILYIPPKSTPFVYFSNGSFAGSVIDTEEINQIFLDKAEIGFTDKSNQLGITILNSRTYPTIADFKEFVAESFCNTQYADVLGSILSQVRIMLGFGLDRNENNSFCNKKLFSEAELEALKLYWLQRMYEGAHLSLHRTWLLSQPTYIDNQRILTPNAKCASMYKDAVDGIRALEKCALDAESENGSGCDLLSMLTVARETYQTALKIESHPEFHKEFYFSKEYLFILYAPYWMPITLPLLWGLVLEFKRWFRMKKAES